MKLRNFVLSVLLFSVAAEGVIAGQNAGTTVRKRREVVAEDSFATTQVVRAEAAMAKQDYASAEKDLLDATVKDPKNYQAWFDLGFVYNATNRAPQAIDAYRKSVAANPQVFESTLNLGILLARMESPEAEQYIRKATTLKPTAHQEEGWYRAWISLATLLAPTKPLEAVEAYRNAAKLNPKDQSAHLLAAGLLEQQKQLDEAAAEYQKAADLDPKSVEALGGLVNVLTKLEKFPEAETALRKFTALDPANWIAHVQLGRVLAAQHKWDDATAELEIGLKAKPGDVAAEKELAHIYLAQKLYPEAAKHVSAALQNAPNDPQLHHWLGVSFLHQLKYAEAQAEFMAAVKLKPDFGEAYSDLALAAYNNKNYVLTLKSLEVRAKFLPEVPGTYFLRATAFDSLKDYKQASENYRQFLAVADGRFPDEEWKARHRLIAIDPKGK